MKKNVKAIFAGLAAAALLAGFSSCSNGSSDDSLNKPAGTSSGANQIDTNNDEVFSGDLITYVISVASTDSENTKLILQYDRSAAGAKEQISLTDADLALTVNGAAVDTPKTITFALDSYSSFRDGYDAGKDGEEKDASKHKTYKCTIDLKKQLSVNDKVTLQLNKAKVTGEGAASVKLGSIVATIVDIAPAAKYWRELSETKYQTLITKKNGADLNATVAVEEPANPTPANNTPENPAPANPTPENPTPATPENTSTNTNNTSTPAATTPTPVTVTNCKQYTVKLTKDITDASIIGFVLQIDNDGSQDANGLKIDISNLTMSVKVGNGDFTDKTFDEFNLVPNQYSAPNYSKTDARKRLGLTGSLTQGTEITFSIKSATISDSAKKDAIIFALQEDADPWNILGTESGENQDVWFSAFATN